MKYLLFIGLSALCISGCHFSENFKQEKARVIQLSVEASLELDPGLNSQEYYIDFSRANYFDTVSIHEFLEVNPNFQLVNGDSLLMQDSTWNKYGYLDNMLIRFDDIETKGDSIIIHLEKIRASDGANGIEIILQKDREGLKILNSKITSIS